MSSLRQEEPARIEVDGAVLATMGRAAHASETDSPLHRLADIHDRIERVRVGTDSMVDRARRTVDASQAARDRKLARDRVTRLRHNLDEARHEIAGLRTAMETRGVIEQAKGMIMAAVKVDADTAFEMLVRRSQTTHEKLVVVARDVVETGRHGSPGPLQLEAPRSPACQRVPEIGEPLPFWSREL